MAAAAASAAANKRELARQLDVVRKTANTQLTTLLTTVIPLEKHNDLNKLTKQLHTLFHRFDYPTHILDASVPDLTQAERDALDLKKVEDLTKHLAIKNAYAAITALCDGSDAGYLVEGATQDHARSAMDILRNYYFPSDAAGKRAANKLFHNATMANTNTTIVQWTALVRQNAKTLRSVGGQADNDAELGILIEGLLPEFDRIKHTLDQESNLTMAKAIQRLTAYARSYDLLTLTKGKNNTTAGARVFEAAAETVHRPERNAGCRGWMSATGCKYGIHCKYRHDDPMGKLAKTTNVPWPIWGGKEGRPSRERNQPSTTPTASNASTYTAQEVPAATYTAYTTENVPPRFCYTCMSAAHNTGECTSRQHDAEEEDEVEHTRARAPHAVTALLMAVLAFFTTWVWDSLNTMRKALTMANLKCVLLVVVAIMLVGQAMAETTPMEEPARVWTRDAACLTANSTSLDTDAEWIADTGSNRFATWDERDFVEGTIRLVNTSVMVGNGTVISPMMGTIMVRSHATGKLLACTNALLLPNCAKKLMPAHPFLKNGCTMILSDDQVVIKDAQNKLVLDGKAKDGLYYYNATTAHLVGQDKDTGEATNIKMAMPGQPKHTATTAMFGLPLSGHVRAAGDDFARKLMEAHETFGHVSFDVIRKMFKVKPGPNPDCRICAICKQKTGPLCKHHDTRAKSVNHRIHIDMAFTEGGDPFQVYVDCCNRVSHLDVMSEGKHQALPMWKELKLCLENRHYPAKVAFIMTDNEFIYTSKAFIEHCRDEGVEHEFSARYRHDQNSVVERAIGVIGTIFRCLMIQGGAPDEDIPNALCHANVIRNNTPTKANNGWTPKEKEAGMKLGLNVRLMKGPLFCLVYAHIYKDEPARVKHGPRGVACVYLGYDDRNNQYKVKEWLSGRIYYTGDAVFHPKVFPYRASPAFTEQWLNEIDSVSPRIPVSANNPAPHSQPTGPRRSVRQHSYTYSGGQAVRDIPDVDHVDEAADEQAHAALFVHMFGPDPDTWEQALASRHSSEWILASLKEKASFQQHKVYKLVLRTEAEATGKKIRKPRPVFKIKINPPTKANPEPTLEKFKFRQTIAAYTKSMRAGIDFTEKRASTVRWEATLVKFALAVMFDLEIVLFDSNTCFLYGELDDLDYMEQPPEWVDARYPAHLYVCRLLRSMYGLPQAPHCAQKKLKACLTAGKAFTQTQADDCVFVSGKAGEAEFAATGTHVDDLLSVGTTAGITKLEHTLEKDFEITKKPNPTLVTGVEVERNRGAKWLKLHQGAYIDTILEEFGQTDCTPAMTPMDAGTATKFMQLPTATPATADPLVQAAYRKLVGMLIWLYKTRPDMMFTINFLARRLHDSTQAHFNLARGRPLRYLKGTRSHGLVFAPGHSSNWVLSGSSDADLAGDLATARSTTGFYSKLGEYGAVSFHCTLERKVATSTQQAETYGLLSLVKDTIWLRQLTHELGFGPRAATRQRTDNQGVHLQSTKQVNHATAKHFRIAQAFIRNNSADGVIAVDKVGTKDNAADLFTKASIPAEQFFKCRLEIMGPQECPPNAM
jgi:hypothetical protein